MIRRARRGGLEPGDPRDVKTQLRLGMAIARLALDL